MTDRKLLSLYHERMAQLDATNRYGGWTLRELREHAPEKRAEIDRASKAFLTAEKAIVEELIARGGSAKLKGVTLHLTADQKNFAALNPGTETPLGWTAEAGNYSGMTALLYRRRP